MADVRPFRGLRYSAGIAAHLTDVLCPPYDIISPPGHQALQRRSPHNAVHVELPQGDDDQRYTRAAEELDRWRHEGVLVQDSRPSYYVQRHRFTYRGRALERLGLTALVRLEEFDRQVVLPHEETRSAPKEDRLRLMEACRANLSPIMSLYRDPDRRIRDILARVSQTPPGAVASYDDSQELAQWVVDAPELDQAVQATLQDAPLFIADGHHRYETALAYRDRARRRAGTWEEKDAFNYMMMTLIDFEDPGLLLLPYHRTVGGLDPATLTVLRDRLGEFFEEGPLTPMPTGPEDLEEAVIRQGTGARLGLLGPDGQGPSLLTLRHGESLDRLRAVSGGGSLHDSEGWVLHQAILDPVLGTTAVDHVNFVHDPREAWDSVSQGRQQMAFFVRPFPMDLFQTVVSVGHRLPSKSTYFHPKLPTGLVFNPLDGEV
ncbi:MAG: DUF1015 domain-containing protein [Dehalococcoidia bacterium]